jgi:hypothetical protein
VIELTQIGEKPEPPPLPETAQRNEPEGDATIEDVQAHEALDPALKNPEVVPTITPAPVVSNPQQNTPQMGDKNDKGEIYIDGFGWVKNEGGGGRGEPSSSDGDWDKIIGH